MKKGKYIALGILTVSCIIFLLGAGPQPANTTVTNSQPIGLKGPDGTLRHVVGDDAGVLSVNVLTAPSLGTVTVTVPDGGMQVTGTVAVSSAPAVTGTVAVSSAPAVTGTVTVADPGASASIAERTIPPTIDVKNCQTIAIQATVPDSGGTLTLVAGQAYRVISVGTPACVATYGTFPSPGCISNGSIYFEQSSPEKIMPTATDADGGVTTGNVATWYVLSSASSGSFNVCPYKTAPTIQANQ